jgi:hypothetical protein
VKNLKTTKYDTMKNSLKIILTGIIIIYLLIGLGIDQYSDYKLSQSESLLEGVARDLDRYGPGHIMSIVFWPFYL